MITTPETGDAYDVLPFLFPRFGENIEKQITKMHEAVSHVTLRKSYWTTTSHTSSLELRFSDLKKEVREKDGRKEFAGSEGHKLKCDTSSLQMIHDPLTAKDLYLKLALLALVLRRSRFPRSLRDVANRMHRD